MYMAMQYLNGNHIMQENKKHLKSLGISAGNVYRFEPPELDDEGRPVGLDRLLERAPFKKNRASGREMTVRLFADEFTSLCPVTAQPDFGTIEVVFIPDSWIVETKSLKLYLMQYRQFGFFQEELVQQICDDLTGLLEPISLEVTGDFKPRGGVGIKACASYKRI